jgi:hypothetical protein
MHQRRRILPVLLGLLVLLAAAPLARAGQAVTVLNPSGVRESGTFVDELLLESMRTQGLTRPSLAGAFPRSRTETVQVRADASAEIGELFYRRGWTDGLPIVPPTPERVREMLRGADISPEFAVAVLPPLDGQATIEKIAVNAVMAGCRPAHMPILIAAVEAVSQSEADLRGVAARWSGSSGSTAEPTPSAGAGGTTRPWAGPST